MRYRVWLAAVSAVVLCGQVCAETLLVEQQRRSQPGLASRSDMQLQGGFCTSDFEYGWVEQGDREGDWKMQSLTLGYAAGKFTPYVLAESWERFREEDYTLNAGAYYRIASRSYLHAQVGFGLQRDYLYRNLIRLEYEQPLAGRFNWFLGGRCLTYSYNDVYILYPGLIYYWGDSYAQFFFNDAFTESRGSAQSVQGKVFYALISRLGAYAGAALGERLYDIFLLPAASQDGYIGFCGVEYRLNNQARARVGYSYSHENPRFIKRSVEAGIFLTF